MIEWNKKMNNKLKIISNTKELTNLNLEQCIVVIVDVLRASSTITTLFAKGAKLVYSVHTINEAKKLKNENKKRILVGERYGIMINNFDFGNSPYIISKNNFNNKEIIFTSSNFSRILNKYLQAYQIIVGCILNAKFVANFILKDSRNENFDIILIEVGTFGSESEEDKLGCKIISDYIKFKTTDITKSEIKEILLNCKNGIYLSKLGYEKDVEFCSLLNKYKCVPINISGNKFIGVI